MLLSLFIIVAGIFLAAAVSVAGLALVVRHNKMACIKSEISRLSREIEKEEKMIKELQAEFGRILTEAR